MTSTDTTATAPANAPAAAPAAAAVPSPAPTLATPAPVAPVAPADPVATAQDAHIASLQAIIDAAHADPAIKTLATNHAAAQKTFADLHQKLIAAEGPVVQKAKAALQALKQFSQRRF